MAISTYPKVTAELNAITCTYSPNKPNALSSDQQYLITLFSAGLNKFARLARSVTRNRTMLQTPTSASSAPHTNALTSPQWGLLSPESAATGGTVDGGRTPSPSPRTPSPFPPNHDEEGLRGGLLSPTGKSANDLEKGATVRRFLFEIVLISRGDITGILPYGGRRIAVLTE